MAENSKIQWTDHTFNPWRGCQKVAAGCANCYAETLSKRNPGTLGIWGPNGTRVFASEAMWRQPVKWNEAARVLESRWPYGGGLDKGEYRRPRVFCASLADVFEDWAGIMRGSKGGYLHHADKWNVRDGRLYIEIADIAIGKSRVTMKDARDRLFSLIDDTPNLDWLLLTKRPENIDRMWPYAGVIDAPASVGVGHHRPNVWLGTSLANQEDAERNIPELRTCRNLAAQLFVSAEPLIGPVDLVTPPVLPWLGLIDWVIVGGESGPHARPCNVEWIRSIVRQCQAAGVPCFVKQLGAVVIDRNDAGFDGDTSSAWPGPQDVLHHIHGFREDFQGADCRVLLRDSKGGDPSEWPDDLRVREFPKINSP